MRTTYTTAVKHRNVASLLALLAVVMAISVQFVAADTSASFGVPVRFLPSDSPERYIYRIPDTSDFLFVDFVQCKDPFNLVIEWHGNASPAGQGVEHPGDKDVLYFDLSAMHADGSGGVPDFNIVLIYQYADLSPYMSHVRVRKDMRFGLFDNASGRWDLFRPGADNSDPPTRVVSQGVSSITDLKRTTTTIGLFAENLHQDVLSRWKTTYRVEPDGQAHSFQFAVSNEENDFLWLDLQTQRVPFSFHVTKHDNDNPVPDADVPQGTNGGILFFDLVIEGRNNVPEGTHCTLRYQYDNATTTKMHYVRKETLTFGILKGNAWRPFKGNQQNNIFTSNLIQSTSELLDLTDATSRIGVFGDIHNQPINNPDGTSSAAVKVHESGWSLCLMSLLLSSAIIALLQCLVHHVK